MELQNELLTAEDAAHLSVESFPYGEALQDILEIVRLHARKGLFSCFISIPYKNEDSPTKPQCLIGNLEKLGYYISEETRAFNGAINFIIKW